MIDLESAQEIIAKILVRAQSEQMALGELIVSGEQLKSLGRKKDTLELYKNWLAFNSSNELAYMAYFNYAVMLSEDRDIIGAISALNNCISIKKDFMSAYINLGSLYELSGLADRALATWQLIVDHLVQVTNENNTFKASALKQIARVTSLRSLSSAEKVLEESLNLDPGQIDVLMQWISLRQRQIKWPVLPNDFTISKNKLLQDIAPLSLACYADDPIFQLANAAYYNRSFVKWPAEFFSDSDYKMHRDESSRLKIGYISSDMRDHAVGYSMAEVFELHDRSKVEVFTYFCGSVRFPDSTQNRIKAATDHWKDIYHLTDAEAAQQILDDGIHILVDLNGYTKDAKTSVFSMLPAPININWFGYPGTMGSPYHHYIIADGTIIPEDYEKYYSEKVVRLECYQPNDRKRTVSPRIPTRAEAGLPGDAFVFCSFNGFQKLNLATFKLWLRILSQVPNSVLWLLSDLEEAKNQLRQIAITEQIDPERLVFAGPLLNPDHLARYNLADLFLDSMPYGAHTTAADSLWMGIPILTLPGESFASRVCSSILKAAGLEEFIANSQDDYVSKAAKIASDKTRLASLKNLLISQRSTSTLFNSPKLVRDLEGLYAQMWQDYLAGNLPKPDMRNLDIYHDIAINFDHEQLGLINRSNNERVYIEAMKKRDLYSKIPIDSRIWRA